MRRGLVAVCLLSILVATGGCELLTLAIGIAAKALPYLIFLADAEPVGTPAEPDALAPGVPDDLQLALEETRRRSDDLPSGLAVLDEAARSAPGPGQRIAVAVPADDPQRVHEVHRDLMARYGALRVVAVDGRPLLQVVESGQSLEERIGPTLVWRAEGPLEAAADRSGSAMAASLGPSGPGLGD